MRILQNSRIAESETDFTLNKKEMCTLVPPLGRQIQSNIKNWKFKYEANNFSLWWQNLNVYVKAAQNDKSCAPLNRTNFTPLVLKTQLPPHLTFSTYRVSKACWGSG